MESKFGNRRPLGVTIVSVLTWLSSAVVFFFGIFLFAIGARFGKGIDLLTIIYFVLGAFGFFLSSRMFHLRARFVWYVSIVFWVAFLIHFICFYTVYGIWRYMFYMEGPLSTFYGVLSVVRILGTSFPLVYAVGCMAYFMSRTPRQYFSESKVLCPR